VRSIVVRNFSVVSHSPLVALFIFSLFPYICVRSALVIPLNLFTKIYFIFHYKIYLHYDEIFLSHIQYLKSEKDVRKK